MADQEQTTEPGENTEETAVAVGEEQLGEENNAEQAVVSEEGAVNEDSKADGTGDEVKEAPEQAPADAPADGQQEGNHILKELLSLCSPI